MIISHYSTLIILHQKRICTTWIIPISISTALINLPTTVDTTMTTATTALVRNRQKIWIQPELRIFLWHQVRLQTILTTRLTCGKVTLIAATMRQRSVRSPNRKPYTRLNNGAKNRLSSKKRLWQPERQRYTLLDKPSIGLRRCNFERKSYAGPKKLSRTL